jgi:hypothetical protein
MLARVRTGRCGRSPERVLLLARIWGEGRAKRTVSDDPAWTVERAYTARERNSSSFIS